MLHGWAATSESWRLVFDDLKRDHRVIAPDLPGHGRSGGGFRAYTIDYYRRWLEDLLQSLNVQHAVIMGNSLGGAVSLSYAAQNPLAVSRLVLVDALGVGGDFPWASAGKIAQRLHHLAAWGAMRRSDPYLLRYLRGMVFYDPWQGQTDDIIEMSELNVRRGIWPGLSGLEVLLGDFLLPGKRRAFQEQLPELQMPTLIVWGRYDGLLPVRDAFTALDHMECARAVIFEKSAHVPMMEEPEAFITVLRAFLASEC